MTGGICKECHKITRSTADMCDRCQRIAELEAKVDLYKAKCHKLTTHYAEAHRKAERLESALRPFAFMWTAVQRGYSVWDIASEDELAHLIESADIALD